MHDRAEREGFSRANMHTTLPRRFYADPDFYRAELERFYFNRWICAGRADQIPNAGDYFTRTLGDESVIVTRDASGEIHALFNVCRHRGTRLCDQTEGHLADRIQCPYHNWTYALDGQLLAAPHMPPDFSKDDYPLHRAGCDVWDGHVFVHLGLEGQDGQDRRDGQDGRELPCGPARGSARSLCRVAHGRAPAGPPHRLRREGELEADRPELQRVPALSEPASGAEQAAPLSRRRQRRADRVLLRRRDGISRRRRDDEHRRQAAAGLSAGTERGAAAAGRLLRDLSEPAPQPASRLRDDAHAVAARATIARRSSASFTSIRASSPRPARRSTTRWSSGT